MANNYKLKHSAYYPDYYDHDILNRPKLNSGVKKMKPYLVAVVLQPTKKQEEEGVEAKLVVEAKTVLAANVEGAKVKALTLVGSEYLDATSRLEAYALPLA